MEKENPMMRLLEGDVGSGKTVVAVIAMLNAALNKKQSVLMAPTEILAHQHFESIKKSLSTTDLKIALLTASEQRLSHPDPSARLKTGKKQISEMIKNGGVDIIIGTHALIQEKIGFKNLGLAIIDEQHRFGVEQRKKLIEKSNNKARTPHLLSMTATPIPRSLALVLYGDLDISILDEMPVGRKKVLTKIVPEEKRNDAYKFIRAQIESGRQIFVICPLIDISDKLGVKSAKEEYKKLNEKIFPDLKIGILHGRMKSKEKEEIMKQFLENKIKILVSTSVVEVGVDAPNASI
ncbi:MAG: DEAD/DEAH box helicase, partial [bacterium]